MVSEEKEGFNKFENMTDDEVMDIATTPNMNEKLASEAEAEIRRRELKMESVVRVAEALKGENDPQPQQELTPPEPVSSKNEYDEYLDDETPTYEKFFHRNRTNHINSHLRRETEKKMISQNEALFNELNGDANNSDPAETAEAAEKTYDKAELFNDAEKQIRNKFDDFMVAGLMSDFHRGNSAQNYRKIIKEQYYSFLDRRADSYGVDDKSDLIDDIKTGIDNQVIDKLLEEKTAEIAKLEKEALVNLIAQGINTEQNEFGEKELTYSIPTGFSPKGPQIEQFEKRFGATEKTPAKEFMEKKGINFEDPEVQNASFGGFFDIADAVRQSQEPDASKLDWYFDNFDYGNQDTLVRFLQSLETSSTVNEDSRKFIAEYLKNKPAYQEYLENLNSQQQQEDEAENLGKEILNVELENGIDAVRKALAEYGYTEEEIERMLEDDDPTNKIFTQAEPFYDKRGNKVIRTGEDKFIPYDPDADGMKKVFDPESEDKRTGKLHGHGPSGEVMYNNGSNRIGEHYRSAKVMALSAVYKEIIENIDPNAQIFFPIIKGKNKDGETILNDRQYAIIRFGCKSLHRNEDGTYTEESYNHVIAESLQQVGATYLWYGHGDNWRAELHGTKKNALRLPNVDRRVHDAKEALIVHYRASMYRLGIRQKEA